MTVRIFQVQQQTAQRQSQFALADSKSVTVFGADGSCQCYQGEGIENGRENEGHFLPLEPSNLVQAFDVFQQIGCIVGLGDLDLECDSP